MKRFVALFALLMFSSVAHAQDVAPVLAKSDVSAANTEDARVKALEEQVRTLAGEVALLRCELKELRDAKLPGQASSPQVLLASSHPEPGMLAPAPAPAAPQVAQTQTFGGASGNAKLLNPDISLIGDFIGTAGRNTVSPSRSLELHESEVGMQAIIDPYARADVFISFGETGVNVEEGYVTFTSLPAGLLLKVGKMRAEFGKVNTIHNHALPFIDRPLATNNLVGGEDGIDDAGISLSRFLPAPKNWFVQGTAQVYRGDSSDVFTANRRQDVSAVGAIFASTATSANRPTWTLALRTPAVTTLRASAHLSILPVFSPICTARMRPSVGSRSAAPSTIPSFSAPSSSGALAISFLRSTFSKPSTPSACTPPRNTASIAAGPWAAASIAVAVPPTPT